MLRAKFVVTHKGQAMQSAYAITEEHLKSTGLTRDQIGSVLVVLKPVYSGSTGNSEDAKFQNATSPDGELRMMLLNSNAAEFFEFGKAYYADFQPAE